MVDYNCPQLINRGGGVKEYMPLGTAAECGLATLNAYFS